MSHLLTILGLAISSNLDTLGVGLAYGTKKFRLPFLSNFVCALIPCIGTYIMMILGTALRSIISNQLGNILGAGIIMVAGAVLIIQYFRRPGMTNQKEIHVQHRVEDASPVSSSFSFLKELGKILEDPFRVDYDYSGSIEIHEAIVLALALTLNNLSCGFAAGLMGLSISLLVMSSFIVSILFFYAGVKIGLLYLARWFGKKGDLVAGIMLILLGIYELLT